MQKTVKAVCKMLCLCDIEFLPCERQECHDKLTAPTIPQECAFVNGKFFTKFGSLVLISDKYMKAVEITYPFTSAAFLYAKIFSYAISEYFSANSKNVSWCLVIQRS